MSGVISRIAARVKGSVYKTVVRPVMILMMTELGVAVLMLRFSLGERRRDMTRNEDSEGVARVERF